MPALVMVDDPAYQGKGPPPQIPRSWAMRKLAEAGVSIRDIATRYGVPYQRAYNAVNFRTAAELAALQPESADLQPAARSKSAAPDELPAAAPKRRPGPKIKTHTRAELKSFSIRQLKDAITNKGLEPNTQYAKDLEAELDAREPGWWDNL